VLDCLAEDLDAQAFGASTGHLQLYEALLLARRLDPGARLPAMEADADGVARSERRGILHHRAVFHLDDAVAGARTPSD